jgi:hypothetical protein
MSEQIHYSIWCESPKDAYLTASIFNFHFIIIIIIIIIIYKILKCVTLIFFIFLALQWPKCYKERQETCQNYYALRTYFIYAHFNIILICGNCV